MEVKQQLQSLDTPKNGEELEMLESVVKGTVFWSPGEQLTDKNFFANTNLDPMYQTPDFPSNSIGYVISHIKIEHDMLFKVTNPEEQMARLRHFMEQSQLVITANGTEKGRFWICDLIPVNITPTRQTLATDQFQGINNKFSQWYKLSTPLKIAASRSIQFELKAAKGLELAASDAKLTPYYPQSGLTDSKGHSVKLYLRGAKMKERL